MQCNIDATGKRIRLVAGIISLIIAMLLAMWAAINTTDWWVWIIIGAIAASGCFAMFEARAGWCALRAIGIKTPV